MDEKYVMSCRVRTGRSIRGFCLPPHCNRAERRAVEKVTVDALNKLTGDFKGKYYPLNAMTEQEQDQLIADHFLFDKPVCKSYKEYEEYEKKKRIRFPFNFLRLQDTFCT